MARHKIVVVGGGFGGLEVVRNLKGAPVDITLIDRRNHHLFQPLLYQVAVTTLATSEIAWPIRNIVRNRPEVTTLLGEVVSVDRVARKVRLKDDTVIDYDTLVLATGSRHAYFGNDHWEAVAPGLKTLEDATTIRRRILLAFERAEIETDPDKRRALLTFVIVGAGPTGVEMAGTIAELAHVTLKGEFRNSDPASARVVLIEAGPRILAAFTEPMATKAQRSLEQLGVEVLTGTAVSNCDENGVIASGTLIPAKTLIWAAGVKASDAAVWLSANADRNGRVIVQPDLRLPDDPSIFVIGDTASVMREDGKPVPGIAPAAKQQGDFVAKCIRAAESGTQAPTVFHYKHLGNLATIGKHRAVIEFGSLKLSGTLAWGLWGLAHIYFLIGARSRWIIAYSWFWIYLTGHRSARLITQKETLRDF